jgi:quinol monooxygenase YgiN
MIQIQGSPGEIHELARYEVRPEALDEVISAIHEFVAYVRENEAGALRYEVWQESQHPTCFVHLFVSHEQSAAVKKCSGILYPKCLAPVEFTEYRQLDADAAFRRV